jgi:DNA invertase Pin-like site-specific DNA recombinase
MMGEASPQVSDLRREAMKAPDDVSAMIRLKALGWGLKKIAAERGCSRKTVRRWLTEGDWRPCASPSRSKKLERLTATQVTIGTAAAADRYGM